jgi:hypothetical protein
MEQESEIIRFEIPNPLRRMLHECETRCVGPCCGRKAFDFSPEVVRGCIGNPSLDLARQQLDELIDALEYVPGPVSTFWINTKWTGQEAAGWFADFRSALDSMLKSAA